MGLAAIATQSEPFPVFTPMPSSADVFDTKRKAATRALSDLITQRTNEYNQYYAPLASSIRNDALYMDPTKVADEAGAMSNKSFDASAGAIERQQRALGVGPVAGQANRLGLRRVLAEVDARNNAMSAAKDRQRAAQEAATQQYSNDYATQGNILQSISGMELKRMGEASMQGAQNTQTGLGVAGLALSAVAVF